MHLIYIGGRLYPFLAIAMVVFFAQLALFYRRTKSSSQFFFWGVCGFFCISAVLWVVFRGDIHSDEWLNAIFS
jgi:hypothetical protein